MNRLWFSIPFAPWVLAASLAWAVTLPTLPQAQVNVTMPTVTGSTLNATCATLQAQLDAAAALNVNLTHQVTLATGTQCTGVYYLRAHAGPGWILVTGPNGGVVPSGTRVAPANAASMPQIKYGATGGDEGAFVAQANATHYRIIGIDMIGNSGINPNFSYVTMGFGNHPDFVGTGYIILDRVLIRDLDAAHFTVRGVGGDAELGNVALVDSYCSGVKHPDADAQCWLSVNQPGPVLIQNSYTQATGENIMFGGGQPSTGFSDQSISVAADTFQVFGGSASWPVASPVHMASSPLSCRGHLPSPLASGVSTEYYVIPVSTVGNVTTIKLATSVANANAGTAINITDLGTDCQNPPQPCVNGSCSYGLTNPNWHPKDMTVRLNTYDRDPTWTDATYHQMKSEQETKLCKRCLFDANTFTGQNFDGGGQSWRATVRSENAYFWQAELSDVTWTNNLFTNVCSGISSFGSDDGGGNGQSTHSKRWNIANNLYVLGANCGGQGGVPRFYTVAIGGGGITAPGIGSTTQIFDPTTGQLIGAIGSCTDNSTTCKMEDLTIRHNTVALGSVASSNGIMCVMSAGQLRMDFKDNLIDDAGGPGVLDCNGALTGNRGTAILDAAWGVGGYSWTGNGIAAIAVGGEGSGIYPQPGNIYWANASSILFTNPAAFDYTLQAGSPAKNAASDGKDMGVDFNAFNTARGGGGPPPDTTPPSAPTELRVVLNEASHAF